MTVKEMYASVLELVGLDQMPEDSGIVYDNGKDVKRVLAGIDMDVTMLMLAKQHSRFIPRPRRRAGSFHSQRFVCCRGRECRIRREYFLFASSQP